MKVLPSVEEARAALLPRVPWEPGPLPAPVKKRLREVFGRGTTPEKAVKTILEDVRSRGDAALREWTKRLDGVELQEFEVGRREISQASRHLNPELLQSLSLAAERIRLFHEQARLRLGEDWLQDGVGQLFRPLERVGVYAPGGTTPYASTVLMTAIPAKVAGVSEIILASPPRSDGTLPLALLAAAELAGVSRIFNLGGAVAIAALAYGTGSVPRVDKVCGPGNLFVLLAKKEVFGITGIDGLYGPTETVLIADESASPALCAADLLAQAEHDPLASAILVTPSARLAREVEREIKARLPRLERSSIARAALKARGAIVLVKDIEEGIELANDYAPEHLCLMVANPARYVDKVRHAGGLFLGETSSEALGDYMAGPSHVMPTGGTARFGSPLGVQDFIKIISRFEMKEEQALSLTAAAAILARAEGLTAHAQALEERLSLRKGKNK